MKKLPNFKEIAKPSKRVIHLSNLISHCGIVFDSSVDPFKIFYHFISNLISQRVIIK